MNLGTSNDDWLARIAHLNEIGIALSSEKDIDGLLQKILTGAKALTNADAGTLYLADERNQMLNFSILLNDSLKLAQGAGYEHPVELPALALCNEKGVANLHNVAAYAANKRQVVNVPDAYSAEGFDFSGTRIVDDATGYHSQSFLTVPMENHEGDLIGVLQLINAKDDQGNIRAFDEVDASIVRSLASQAAVALTQKRLINDQKKLFEAFIELIAKAIDEKNPHTSAHCSRVPDLTLMIAEAASEVGHGPLKEFQLSEDELYEIRIAAWMHDCGKVTTPEHVINKATKLETIVDRIESVETRFCLVRDQLHMAKLSGDIQEAEFHQKAEELTDDFEFIARANKGGEFMAPEDQQRVAEIAHKYSWRDMSGTRQAILDQDEVYNLQIAKGTITAEERAIMNNHMAVTIAMLESLPYPKHLKNVPEIAGGHHERMDGRGFPRGLTREQLSIPARMMGIADIFEALTASERPYKPPMPLSQALTILGKMMLDNHIDPDLFRLFVEEKVYLKYGKKYLKPEQLDEIALKDIPGLATESA